jgi:FtsZ-binding cell division protein ZapB
MTKFISDAEQQLFFDVQEITPAISKARCRIYYKGANRNRSFITENGSASMIKSLPGVPIVGYYNEEDNDYTDHLTQPTTPYGFVSENPNTKFEEVIDVDGVAREYLSCDVLLWTKRFPEAALIIGQPQSMELDLFSLKGSWQILDGKKFYYIEQASIDALCVLGKNVAPCFEGAKFYQLKNKFKSEYQELIDAVRKYNLIKGGKALMTFREVPVDFEFSFEEIKQRLWEILNPVVTKTDDDGITREHREYRYYVEDVYDTYCIVVDETLPSQHYKLPYTRTEDEISVDLTQMIAVEERYLTIEEAAAVDAMKESFISLQNDVENYQATIIEKDKEIVRLGEENAQMQLKAQEQTTEGQTTYSLEDYELLKSETDTQKDTISQLQLTIEELIQKSNMTQEELKTLKEYQLETENQKKTEFIKQYSEHVDENVMKEWLDDASNYSLTDLKTKIALYMFENGAPAKLTGKQQFVGSSVIDGLGDDTIPGYVKLLNKVKH